MIIKGGNAVNKKYSKYLFIFTTLIIFIGLLNSGCFQLNKGSLWKDQGQNKSISKEERINVLEEKVETLSYSLGTLTTENYELKKNFSELEDVKNQLNKEYTHIKNKQAALDKTQASNNITRNHLKGELAETKIALGKIQRQLDQMESEKTISKQKLKYWKQPVRPIHKQKSPLIRAQTLMLKKAIQIKAEKA